MSADPAAKADRDIETARRFAAEAVSPHAAAWERVRRAPRETLEAAGEAGLMGLLVPE